MPCLEFRAGELYFGVLGHLLDADGLRLEVWKVKIVREGPQRY
jgi:hypothetical protein